MCTVVAIPRIVLLANMMSCEMELAVLLYVHYVYWLIA